MRASLLVVVVAACAGSATTQATTPPPPADADCARAGATVAGVLHADADHAPAIAAVVEHHCRADAWPPAAQACVAAAVDHAAALDCANAHLTDQQHALVDHDLQALVPRGDHDDGNADDARARAEKEADDAVRAARAAQDQAEQAAREVAELATRLDALETAIASANNQADRDAAQAKLESLRRDLAEAKRRAAAAAAAAARAERREGVKVRPECQDNPLAKGCS